MEGSDLKRKKKWKLVKIFRYWYLDVGGKLTRMNILNNAINIYMEDNIIFADNLVYKLTEESDGGIIITDIKDICQKEKTPEYRNNENYEVSGTKANADKVDYEEPLSNEGDRNEFIVQDHPVTHPNRRSQMELKLVKELDYLNSGEEVRETDQEVASEEYVRRKGKIRGFFKRVKQIIKRKPQQKEGHLYEDISNTSKAFSSVNSGNKVDKEDDYDYSSYETMKVHSDSSDAVPGRKRTDFNVLVKH